MPPIRRADLRGKTLEELNDLLLHVIEDGTYTRECIEKVRAKIEKRLFEGDRLNDEEMLDTILGDLNI